MAIGRDWGGIGDKLKKVSTQELEAAIAEMIAKLVGEPAEKVEVSVDHVDYCAGADRDPNHIGSSMRAEMRLSLTTPLDTSILDVKPAR